MNRMTFVTGWRKCLLPFAFLLIYNPLKGQFPKGDPAIDRVDDYFVAGLWKQWNAESRSKGAEKYFATPSFPDRLAEKMADLAAKSVYRGPWEQLRAKFVSEQKVLERLKVEASQEYPVALERLRPLANLIQEAELKRGEASQAMQQLRRLIDGLAYMRHERAISFIGPMLAVDGFTYDMGDAAIHPPEQVASRALYLLAHSKFIDAPAESLKWNLAGWQSWWAENRGRYGPVPAALRAIDAGSLAEPNEPTPIPPPPPLATPPTTLAPSPTHPPATTTTSSSSRLVSRVLIAAAVTAALLWLLVASGRRKP